MILLADCRENTNLNDLFDLTGKAHNNEPHERGKLKSPLLPPLSSSRPFKCSAWNYNKNLHQVWGKNSLDVIEQHIPTDCAFHPSGTAEEFAGQAVGPVSLCSPFFFFFFLPLLLSHYIEMCSSMANHLPLTELQHSHRPVRPIYLFNEEELTLKETRKWVFTLELLYCATWPALPGRQTRGIWELKIILIYSIGPDKGAHIHKDW